MSPDEPRVYHGSRPASKQNRRLINISRTPCPLTTQRGVESFTNLEHPHDKIERSFIKIILWTVGVILVLAVGGTFGFTAYRNWQQRRLVATANALVNHGDYKRASLDARRLLQINPNNADGFRIGRAHV